MPMPPITMNLTLFREPTDQARSQLAMLWLMEALVRINQSHIRQGEELAKRRIGVPYPPLYRSGLHYEREPPGQEVWPDIPRIIEAGWGDCEDLACWRAAEWRELSYHYERQINGKTFYGDPRFPEPPCENNIALTSSEWKKWKRVSGGVRAKPFAKWKIGPMGAFHYHALVLLPDGRLEDASLILGMGREDLFKLEGKAEAYKNGAPVPIQYAETPLVVAVRPEGGFYK